jgi:hypothetical protein
MSTRIWKLAVVAWVIEMSIAYAQMPRPVRHVEKAPSHYTEAR